MLDYGRDSDRFLEISFIGGPFDGHAEIRYTRISSLPENVIRLVKEDVFRWLDGQDVGNGVAKPLSSVALYVLQRANGKNVYHFSGSVCIDRIRSGLDGD